MASCSFWSYYILQLGLLCLGTSSQIRRWEMCQNLVLIRESSASIGDPAIQRATYVWFSCDTITDSQEVYNRCNTRTHTTNFNFVCIFIWTSLYMRQICAAQNPVLASFHEVPLGPWRIHGASRTQAPCWIFWINTKLNFQQLLSWFASTDHWFVFTPVSHSSFDNWQLNCFNLHILKQYLNRNLSW